LNFATQKISGCAMTALTKKILPHFLPDKLHHSQGSHAQFLFLQKKINTMNRLLVYLCD
jgi:hypothetical protein